MESLDQEYQDWLADPDAQREYLAWSLLQDLFLLLTLLEKENHEFLH